MIKYRTIKVRLYPNDFQRKIIDKTFELCSKMYNTLLFEQSNIYADYLNKKDNITDISKYFKNNKKCSVKSIKKADKTNDYYKVDSLALEYEEKNLFNVFKMFFKTQCNYLKYKTLKDKHSYYTRCVNDNICFNKHYIKLPKLGLFLIKGINTKYLNCIVTIVKIYEYKNNKYYAHIVIKHIENTSIITTNLDTKKNVIGLDFKISDLFVSSDGYIPYYPSTYYKYIEHLRVLEKSLKFKSFGSKSRKQHITKIINIHKKIKSFRKLHKISNYLCLKYSSIIIETLDLKEISQKLHNGTNTYDTSYGNFIKLLTYKVTNSIIKLYKRFPSSKLCSNCGYTKKDLTLNDRIYNCNYCGMELDRDLNTAINIKTAGISILKNMKIFSST